jgi:hypothetical protein
VSRGVTNLVGPTAGLSGRPTRQGTCPDQEQSTDLESTTHGEGSDQLTRTQANSSPRHTGVEKAAGDWRMGPTVFEVCSFRLKDSSVTSVTIKIAFLWGIGIPPRRIGVGGAGNPSRPRERTVSRGATNIVGPTAGLCGLPTWQGIGPDQLPRTDREK